jgi:hypothetical protein
LPDLSGFGETPDESGNYFSQVLMISSYAFSLKSRFELLHPFANLCHIQEIAFGHHFTSGDWYFTKLSLLGQRKTPFPTNFSSLRQTRPGTETLPLFAREDP